MALSTQKIRRGQGGFSLTELVTIIAIISTLAAIGGYSFLEMRNRYEVENQVKQFHADILNARLRATLRNKAHFVAVNSNSYQITEDTNESGGNTADAGDTAWFSAPKSFKYPASWTGTVVMSTKGIISSPTNSTMSATNPLSIRFSTSGSNPEYDCVAMSPMRINGGKSNGTDCLPR